MIRNRGKIPRTKATWVRGRTRRATKRHRQPALSDYARSTDSRQSYIAPFTQQLRRIDSHEEVEAAVRAQPERLARAAASSRVISESPARDGLARARPSAPSIVVTRKTARFHRCERNRKEPRLLLVVARLTGKTRPGWAALALR